MLDPIVHAALVTVFAWLVNYIFGLIGLDLGGDVATGLATMIVAYILSLFGYSLYARFRVNVLKAGSEYSPPFT